MNLIFQQKLNEELLRSERRRTIILAGIFSFAIVYRCVDTYILQMDEETNQLRSFATLWLFPFTIVLFEILSLLFINNRIKRKKNKIPLAAQYINAGLEICLPTFIILIVVGQHVNYNVLTSPAVSIYFLFIILSTLRLNFGLSFFCGLLSALSFAIFSYVLYHHFNSTDGARCLIALLAGTAAGLVATQIRSAIDLSVREAEKQQQVINLFGSQVSKEVADKMLENGGVIESRRMNVAIMFIDIRNFTLFVAGKKPEEIVQYQNAFFSIVVGVVEKHGGIVNQFLGDGCMVTFGAPNFLENPSAQAVNAAFELLCEIERNTRGETLPPTKIGIGIHCGEAVTGNIGTLQRQQYSITGNVVILAARIEQLNKTFESQLLVSRDVHISTTAKFTAEAECLGDVELKGWHQPLGIYKLA